MIRGIYAGASGMVAESLRTDVIANNLANVNTAGFKKDVAIMKDFENQLITRINDGKDAPVIGTVGLGTMVDEVAPIHSAGAMKSTGNDFDVAIEGKGFFVIETPQGLRYTRNGTFGRNMRGELITQDGYRVLGQNGPIRVQGDKMIINNDGQVFNGNRRVGNLRVVEFPDEKQLVKEGSSLFIAPAGQTGRPAAGGIRQGFLELANVNVVSEMVNLISSYRAYEVNGKVIQSHDQLMGKAANEVGRL